MTTELQTVLDFCLERVDELPVRRRVSLYRGLAEFCGEPEQSAEFRSIADDLETADRKCREFRFRIANGAAQ